MTSTHPTTLLAALDAAHGLRIGGEAHGAAVLFADCDPATGLPIAQVADGGADAAVAAVDAASAVFPSWAEAAPRARSEVLYAAFELMLAEREELASLISWENGKSLGDARAEVTYAAEFFRWFAEEAARPAGSYGSSPGGGTRTIVTSRPVGVAALVTPWNFPAAMVTRKIGPALAAGCTVVIKPAAETPLTMLAIADLLGRAGAPPGTVNVVPTTDPETVVSSWLADPRVRKISFTGSTGVGRHLLAQAADRVVNSSMELGGNAPFIVAPDADLDAAVDAAMVAKFRNSGQACTAANRFYVHAEVEEEFARRFGDALAALRVGSAFSGADLGPMISRRAVERITASVEEAVASGARIAQQLPRPEDPDDRNGFFFPPTLLVEVRADAAIVSEEIFGPVAPVVRWTDPDEVVALANATEYGLAAYVFSRDLGWALRTAERIEAGMVGINRGVVSDPSAPFGGVKQSGLGREGARQGFLEYTETQYLSVDWS
jgi:succinate-semialdehyde dehydrogenase/glutarate-semialdehyde dehydrogenase